MMNIKSVVIKGGDLDITCSELYRACDNAKDHQDQVRKDWAQQLWIGEHSERPMSLWRFLIKAFTLNMPSLGCGEIAKHFPTLLQLAKGKECELGAGDLTKAIEQWSEKPRISVGRDVCPVPGKIYIEMCTPIVNTIDGPGLSLVRLDNNWRMDWSFGAEGREFTESSSLMRLLVVLFNAKLQTGSQPLKLLDTLREVEVILLEE